MPACSPLCVSGTEAARHAHPDVLGDAFLHLDNSPYNLAIVWVQPHNSVKYTVGVLGLIACDVSERHKGTARMTHVLAIFPGPVAPKNISILLQRTLWAFRKYGSPGHPGILVTEQYWDAQQGAEVCRTFRHKPWLTGVIADSPAR